MMLSINIIQTSNFYSTRYSTLYCANNFILVANAKVNTNHRFAEKPIYYKTSGANRRYHIIMSYWRIVLQHILKSAKAASHLKPNCVPDA